MAHWGFGVHRPSSSARNEDEIVVKLEKPFTGSFVINVEVSMPPIFDLSGNTAMHGGMLLQTFADGVRRL